MQGDCDRQAFAAVEFLQAQLLHPAEPNAQNGEHRTEHGVCHPEFLPTVPIRAHPPRQAGMGRLSIFRVYGMTTGRTLQSAFCTSRQTSMCLVSVWSTPTGVDVAMQEWVVSWFT